MLKRCDEFVCVCVYEFFVLKVDGSLWIYDEGDAEGKDVDMGEGEY